MNETEVYQRIKRFLLIILVLMVMFNFVAILTFNTKLHDNIKAVNILIEHMEK